MSKIVNSFLNFLFMLFVWIGWSCFNLFVACFFCAEHVSFGMGGFDLSNVNMPSYVVNLCIFVPFFFIIFLRSDIRFFIGRSNDR